MLCTYLAVGLLDAIAKAYSYPPQPIDNSQCLPTTILTKTLAMLNIYRLKKMLAVPRMDVPLQITLSMEVHPFHRQVSRVALRSVGVRQ